MFFGGGVSFDAKKDIPSLKGKVILITGGNSGLGKQSALDLASHEPAQIWLAARDTSKAQQAIDEIKEECPNAVIRPLDLDLQSLDSIKNAARTFTQASQRLDVLMLNAGIMASPPGLTKEGYEVQFGTNHVGHALLTRLLTPLLDKTAKEPEADVRVVVMSSAAALMPPKEGIKFESLKTKQEDMPSFTRYGQSKLANALFARHLAKQHPAWTVAAIHPGVVQTNLFQSVGETVPLAKWIRPIFMYMLSTPVAKGARNQLWAATAPKKDIKSGEYYFPVGLSAVARRQTFMMTRWPRSSGTGPRRN